ncbi:TPR Domain containing protein [Anopheles sinensis]|uniref:TPR Domain containing protein n=1 Tax=Anopheles sinensis TaxID=74873 RepID=A0A084VTR8_ANOSI|nr:TPR Domain containing protein [Anopheles sinensis]
MDEVPVADTRHGVSKKVTHNPLGQVVVKQQETENAMGAYRRAIEKEKETEKGRPNPRGIPGRPWCCSEMATENLPPFPPRNVCSTTTTTTVERKERAQVMMVSVLHSSTQHNTTPGRDRCGRSAPTQSIMLVIYSSPGSEAISKAHGPIHRHVEYLIVRVRFDLCNGSSRIKCGIVM